MSAARKAEIWAEIGRLLREFENAQSQAIKDEIARGHDQLRQKMQALAMDTADDEEMT